MSDGHPAEETAVAAAFLQRYLADQEAGAPRSADEYRALWPGMSHVIDRELAALSERATVRTLGGYEIERELGRGGQAVVWLARDPVLERRVALKVLDVLGDVTSEMLARFRREAEVAARLDHSGICGVLDTGIDDGRAWIAMNYVPGETLAARLEAARAGGPTPWTREQLDEVAGLFEEAARALHAAHEAGVIHRDLKPGNLMVTPEGRMVILDFGLAGDELGATLTRTGDVFGTPTYMSPEQLRGRVRLDRRTDVYSLGAALFEALAHVPPLTAPTREALYRAILEDEAPDVRRRNDAIPRDLAVIIATALDKQPDRRFQSAADLAEDLRRFQGREPIRARPVSSLRRVGSWVQRNPVISALATGLFVTLVGGLLFVSGLLAESEGTRSDLQDANVQLANQLSDVITGRAKRRADDVQRLLERGFLEAMGATVGTAAETFEQLLALEPEHKGAILGRVFVESGRDPRTALAVLARVSPPIANDPDVLWMRALLLDQAGRQGEAAALYASAGEEAGDLRLYLMALREIRWFMPPIDLEASRRAHGLFRDAVLRSPYPQYHYVHSLLMSASYARDREDMDQAAAVLEHHWPDQPGTWDAIAQFYLPVDVERAVAALEHQLELGESAAPCCGLAHVAMQSGDDEQARVWFDRAVAVEPDFAPAWYMRGDLSRRQGELDAARLDFIESIHRDSYYPPAWDGLRSVHEAAGDVSAARADFNALAEAHPAVYHAPFQLALFLELRGPREDVLELLERAADLAPHDAAVRRKLDALR
jgi:serine/threonine protein kinase/tetratricopeptide (TPR) repeat protein